MLSQFFASEYNLIGMIGVVMVLVTYFLLQIERLSAKSFHYSFFNFLGSILILISLAYTWNLSSGVIEIVWLFISAFGVGKYFYHKAKK